MSRRKLATLVSSALLATSFPVKAANTYYVPSQYPTIAAALAVASSGDTILVAAGTYNNMFTTLNKGVTIQADGVVNFVNTLGSSTPFFTVASGGVSIRNIDFSSTTPLTGVGIRLASGVAFAISCGFNGLQYGIFNKATDTGAILCIADLCTFQSCLTGVSLGYIQQSQFGADGQSGNLFIDNTKFDAYLPTGVHTFVANTFISGVNVPINHAVAFPNGATVGMSTNTMTYGPMARNPGAILFGGPLNPTSQILKPQPTGNQPSNQVFNSSSNQFYCTDTMGVPCWFLNKSLGTIDCEYDAFHGGLITSANVAKGYIYLNKNTYV
jgi:hypothetical protein